MAAGITPGVQTRPLRENARAKMGCWTGRMFSVDRARLPIPLARSVGLSRSALPTRARETRSPCASRTLRVSLHTPALTFAA